MKFGSVFVSAIRFCGVSVGVSAGDSAGVSASVGRLGCFVSAAFLRGFGGPLFWTGIDFWIDGQTDGLKKSRRRKFVSAANSS